MDLVRKLIGLLPQMVSTKCRLQNADCVLGTKCRMQTLYKMQSGNKDRLICDKMPSKKILSVMQSLFRDHFSRSLA